MAATKKFYVVIEYMGEVPQLQACYSQGKTIDELIDISMIKYFRF